MGYARKDVEKTKKIAKKFVRYQEEAQLMKDQMDGLDIYVAGFFSAQLETHILHKAL